MSRSREGSGRHRQAWIDVTCPDCGLTVQARRTLPGRPLHIRAHLTDEGVCPPIRDRTEPSPPSATMTS